jgi:hypothetical protein
VLLLDNDKVYEGDIERVGDQYRLRRAAQDGESWLPCSHAARLCETMTDAYAFLRSRANLNDPDECLRLARWCHLHELHAQAFLEVKAAHDLRPDHGDTERLLKLLEQSATLPTTAAQPTTAEPAPPFRELPPIDLDTESLSQFVTHVQPILMNTCVSCHGTGHGGSLQLMRVYGMAPASRRATQQNLAAVLTQISLAHPSASPLLLKAVTAHWSGENTQPPFKGRQAPAYRVLEDWVVMTVAHNPQLAQRLSNPDASAAFSQPGPANESTFVGPRAEFARLNPGSSAVGASSPTSVQPRELPPNAQPVTAPAGPVDQFDPVIFNRQMRGSKKN